MKRGKKMSAEARKRISEAQKARWASKKKLDKLRKEVDLGFAEIPYTSNVPIKEVSREQIRAMYPDVTAGAQSVTLPFVAYVNPLQRKLDIIKQVLEL